MNILLKNVEVLDKNSEWNAKKVDVHISNGKILNIGEIPEPENAKIYDLEGAYVSPGWFDIGTRLTDPGYESIDDMNSLAKSAIKGGFTGLAVFPNTEPANDNKSIVQTIINKSKELAVDLYPVAAISKGCKGTEMSEMMDLHAHGAIAFSDGKIPVAHPGVLSRALRYTSILPTPVINHPEDNNISENGIINEGEMSVYLGMKGRPVLAEYIMLVRDISLCEYNDAHIISHMISASDSVKLVREAKKKKLKINATVSYHNLVANEDVLKDFDSMHKVLPPLRTKSDISALVNGLKDGTIDAIVSNHYPLDVEDKKKAFFDTKFGALGLESLFVVLNYHLSSKLDLELIIEKISNSPREILGLPLVTIKQGESANLTIFTSEGISTFTEQDIKSKSKNSPFIGDKIKGKVLGTVNKGKVNWN
jgi:dihydroorotase